jgi:hypothetical protein
LRLGNLPSALAHSAFGVSERGLEGSSDCERCVNLMRDTERVQRLIRLLEDPATAVALDAAHGAALAACSDTPDFAQSCAAS